MIYIYISGIKNELKVSLSLVFLLFLENLTHMGHIASGVAACIDIVIFFPQEVLASS